MVFYLSGPMEGVSVGEMCGWRDYVTQELHSRGHAVRNPVTSPHNGLQVDRMTSRIARDIVAGDKDYIMQSHMLLANITSLGREYWGTAMEILFASEVVKKPVLVICPAEYTSVLRHPWLIEHVDAWYENVDEFLSAVDRDALPSNDFGDVRLAPVGFVDVSADTLGEFDINEWVTDRLPLGQGDPLRLLICKKIGVSPVVVGQDG
jgi:hypothetical protein